MVLARKIAIVTGATSGIGQATAERFVAEGAHVVAVGRSRAALELAPKGVRVNAVNPGVVVTKLHRRSGMSEEQYAQFLERASETHPLGRPGRSDDIVELILFLVSDRSGWMTGETSSGSMRDCSVSRRRSSSMRSR